MISQERILLVAARMRAGADEVDATVAELVAAAASIAFVEYSKSDLGAAPRCATVIPLRRPRHLQLVSRPAGAGAAADDAAHPTGVTP